MYIGCSCCSSWATILKNETFLSKYFFVLHPLAAGYTGKIIEFEKNVEDVFSETLYIRTDLPRIEA